MVREASLGAYAELFRSERTFLYFYYPGLAGTRPEGQVMRRGGPSQDEKDSGYTSHGGGTPTVSALINTTTNCPVPV